MTYSVVEQIGKSKTLGLNLLVGLSSLDQTLTQGLKVKKFTWHVGEVTQRREGSQQRVYYQVSYYGGQQKLKLAGQMGPSV